MGDTQDKAIRAAILRHIIGNPSQPYAASSIWPASVVQLSAALYSGQNCSFALHDTLLEAGHPEQAKHFKDEQSHPRGCWAVDMILGKT